MQHSLVSGLEAELRRARDQAARMRRSAVVNSQILPPNLEQTERSLSVLRRDWSELKVCSARELGRMRVELANLARLTATACMEVGARSNRIQA